MLGMPSISSFKILRPALHLSKVTVLSKLSDISLNYKLSSFNFNRQTIADVGNNW